MHPPFNNQAANLAVQAYYYRQSVPHGAFQTRNVAALQADLVVFKLTNSFLSAIAVSSAAIDVRMAVQGEHLHRQRSREAREIIDAIPQAMARIKYLGYPPGANQIVRIVGECANHRLLHCVIKFVPTTSARSGSDEAWMRTAHFIRRKTLSRWLSRQQVRVCL